MQKPMPQKRWSYPLSGVLVAYGQGYEPFYLRPRRRSSIFFDAQQFRECPECGCLAERLQQSGWFWACSFCQTVLPLRAFTKGVVGNTVKKSLFAKLKETIRVR